MLIGFRVQASYRCVGLTGFFGWVYRMGIFGVYETCRIAMA